MEKSYQHGCQNRIKTIWRLNDISNIFGPIHNFWNIPKYLDHSKIFGSSKIFGIFQNIWNKGRLELALIDWKDFQSCYKLQIIDFRYDKGRT